ncbi:nucleoside 2-deoxyribosyltransferase domain-containing protein [Pedobacter borealis]|uniref:nucleoside 2-deoxyribosyltransferase domain-containing protein n=1 Tax=Pedobacter borealis TaxID=475254 RepID=UPI0004931159|nr:nucleoside 2-deoxyribosyltransferase domain-containing protein [Pedobacter borealis]
MKKLLTLLCFSFCFTLVVVAQKATIIKSPNPLPSKDNRIKIFLGGSIDMGKSDDWQQSLSKELIDKNVIILNPRRDDWNKDWKPTGTDPNFRKQVEWELNALEASDYIVMYFAPESQSPISLLEFGLYAKSNKLLVVCPDGFWRKGNVDIVSEKYKVETYKTIAEMLKSLQQKINLHK